MTTPQSTAAEVIPWRTMTPEARNRVIAERVMGWQSDKECNGEIGEQPCSPDGWRCLQCGHEGYWGDDFGHTALPPRYSESMDLAWKMLRHLVGETYAQTSQFFAGLGENDGRRRVIIGWDDFRGLTAEKLCIAALHAMGYEVEQ